MSIQSTERVSGPYPCNGLTTQFPFDFKVFNTSEVVAVLTTKAGVESILTLGTDYTVALNSNQDANPGGTLTTLATYAIGYKLTLTSEVANTQPETLTNQGGFYPKVIEHALDRLTIQVQQLAERLGRTVQAPISGGISSSELLKQLAKQLPLVMAVHSHLDDIEAAANNHDDIHTVAGNTGSVNTVAADLGGTWATGVAYDFGNITSPTVGNTSPPGGNIVTVASNIENVNTVVENLDDVGTISMHLPSLLAVASNIRDVQAVASDLNYIDEVAINTEKIKTVADAHANIHTVATHIFDVNAVGTAVADVKTIASITADVSTVANANAAVVALGNDLTGLPIVIDYGDLSPTSSPAAPTGVLGTVWANAENIAAVAANMTAVIQAANNLPEILAALSGALVPANNLSELTDPAIARASLGLADMGGIAQLGA